jgi:nicotinate-nucleotide pyrophosphorylase (carboxylating)
VDLTSLEAPGDATRALGDATRAPADPADPADPAAPAEPAFQKIAPPDPAALGRVIAAALAEDLSRGDPTSEGLFGPDETCRAILVQTEPGVLCGLGVVAAVFAELDKRVVVTTSFADGRRVDDVPVEVALVTGPRRAVLAGERTALNLLARLSGIATEAAQAVALVAGTGATILDTRKTTPGLRDLEKYAVRCGGASNHRHDLGEMLMVKDGHLRLAGGVKAAVARLHETHPRLYLEVEAETLDQVREALEAGVNRILLDNMTTEEMRRAVKLCHEAARGAVETEASGGMTPERLREVAETGVDYISMGALTHSPEALDFSLEAAP